MISYRAPSYRACAIVSPPPWGKFRRFLSAILIRSRGRAQYRASRVPHFFYGKVSRVIAPPGTHPLGGSSEDFCRDFLSAASRALRTQVRDIARLGVPEISDACRYRAAE